MLFVFKVIREIWRSHWSFFKFIRQILRSHWPKTDDLTLNGLFADATDIWIHGYIYIGWYIFHEHWRCALSFLEVIRRISRSHRPQKSAILTRIERFRTKFKYGYEMIHQAWCSLENWPYCCSGSSIKLPGPMGSKSSVWLNSNSSLSVQVWIERWLHNDIQNLEWHRRCAILFVEVNWPISRSSK